MIQNLDKKKRKTNEEIILLKTLGGLGEEPGGRKRLTVRTERRYDPLEYWNNGMME
jgi:hypothetical protein